MLQSFLDRWRRRLQLYGKLPIAKDYLRIGMGDRRAVEWRAWMDQSFSKDLAPGQKRSLLHPVGFVLGLGSRRALLGCLWNSSDAGTQRSFPFCLGLGSRTAKLWARALRGDQELSASLSFLDGVREEGLACASANELMGALRGVRVDPLPPAPSATRTLGFEAWCAALWPGQGIAGLREDLSRLRAEGTNPSIEVLRLPLVAAWDEVEQLQAWMGLLKQAGWARRGAWPNLFLQRRQGATADLGPRSLFATRRALCERDALLLIQPLSEACPSDELRLGSAEHASVEPGGPEPAAGTGRPLVAELTAELGLGA